MACSAISSNKRLLGFLGGYSGLTRDAYALDLRQFASWCQQRQLALFDVARHDIEGFARHLEERRSGAGDDLAAVVHDHLAVSLRRRRRSARSLTGGACASTTPGLRVQRHRAGPQRGRRDAGRRRSRRRPRPRPDLAARVERAAGVGSDRRRHRTTRLERGHRTLVVLRKGGKTVTIPLAPRTARAVDLVVGERSEGPIFVGRDGRRLDRHGAARIVRRIARRAGINKRVGPHTLRHAFITAALDAGVPLRDVQEAASHADPRTTMRYDRARVSLDRHATYIVSTFIAGASR